eukprot:1934044-Rhodomonas_salina.2
MVVHVSSEHGGGSGMMTVVLSLLRWVLVMELSAECRWNEQGAAIWARSRNAAVRRAWTSGRMGCGWVNQCSTGMHAGAGVLVPSVARRAVHKDVNRSDEAWGANSGARWVWRVKQFQAIITGVSAASARRNARGEGLCKEQVIGASSATRAAAAAVAAATLARIAFAAVLTSSVVLRQPRYWAKAGRVGCIILGCQASSPGHLSDVVPLPRARNLGAVGIKTGHGLALVIVDELLCTLEPAVPESSVSLQPTGVAFHEHVNSTGGVDADDAFGLRHVEAAAACFLAASPTATSPAAGAAASASPPVLFASAVLTSVGA